jgi:hypothetical protein
MTAVVSPKTCHYSKAYYFNRDSQMNHTKLFDNPTPIQRLKDAAALLEARSGDEKCRRLGQILRIMSGSAAEFDQYCQMNIEWIGQRLMAEIGNMAAGSDNIDLVSAFIYRFIVEFDLSVKGDLSFELRTFLNQIRSAAPEMTEEARAHIDHARQEMPIAIVKRILNSDELDSLRNVSSIAATVEQKMAQWQVTLAEQEEKALRLGAILEKHTQEFNFVGLHDGFADLSTHIVDELRDARTGIIAFGMLVLVPSAINLWLVVIKQIDLSKMAGYTLLAASIGTLTLTLLFLYFFRIALRKADSCRAQLVQVRLRMTLCRFIQSYADYSKEIKEKNPDALSRFEALIFSGIVSTEDKLPSTFDGIEQLTVLAKSIRGN